MMMHCWCSAADNVVKADEIRTLVKDIWDIRMAKLRSSVDVFLKSDATHAKVPGTQYYTMSTKNAPPPFIFPITLSKINQF